MKLPQKVQVLGKSWAIKYKWNLADEEGKRCIGLCVFDDLTIYIDRSTTLDERPQILLHEIFHAILWQLGIHNTSLTEDIEEVIVDGLSMWVVENMKVRF